MTKTRLFSQASRWAHQILLCQPVPPAPPGGLAALDAAAAELAGEAAELAPPDPLAGQGGHSLAGLDLQPGGHVHAAIIGAGIQGRTPGPETRA